MRVCEDHDATDGRCEACDQRFGVTIHVSCTNCIFGGGGTVSTSYLLANTDVMAFMIEHGIDPLVPNAFHLTACEETILSTDPFEARFTFTAGDDALSLTVDGDLSVVDVTRRDASESVR